jgi:hypothetical protein
MADGFSMTPRLVLEHVYGIFYASKTFYDARKGRRVFSVVGMNRRIQYIYSEKG